MNAQNLLRYRIEIAQEPHRRLQQNLENHNTREELSAKEENSA